MSIETEIQTLAAALKGHTAALADLAAAVRAVATGRSLNAAEQASDQAAAAAAPVESTLAAAPAETVQPVEQAAPVESAAGRKAGLRSRPGRAGKDRRSVGKAGNRTGCGRRRRRG